MMKMGRSASRPQRRALRDNGGVRSVAEFVMVHGESRIVVAVLATFAALFGLGYAIDGLLFDENDVVVSGMATVAFGIVAFVVMLTLHPKDLEHLDQHRHRES